MPTNHFSVRWSGTLLLTNSGDYDFYIMAGVPIRLYINDKLITNPIMVALQESASAKLDHRERNELRLEVYATNNVVPVRILWNGPGFTKTLLTRQNLSPCIASSHEAPLGHGPLQPAGIVLRDGTIVSAPIQSANNSSIRLQGVLAKAPLSLTRVVRIHLTPLSADLASAIPKGRAGVLLKNRDFIDGDFAGIENGKLKIESVLFGNRTFDLAKDVVAVILREGNPPPWRYSLMARDGTMLYGINLRIDANRAGLAEVPELKLMLDDVIEITRRDGAGAP
jgi:hypothetical protein